MGGNGRAASVPRAAGREGQKGTAALCAAPPLENPVESRLRRAQREASPRRPCKTPQKAALDEPIGKHRLGGPAKARRRPPRTSPSGSIAAACARGIRWRAAGKERSTARRRGREGQKGTAALRAAPPFQNPAEGRLRRALRQALFRRPCAVSLAGRQGKGRSTTRARGENMEKGRDCPPVCVNGNVLVRHRCPGGWQRKKNGRAAGREGQKGTAALRAAPPLENPAESRLGRAPREAPPRRHWKNPRGKPASDEPLSDLGKARRKPPRTSPSGSIASAALENPVESRLRRAQREASPRRPCKTPQKAALDEPIGKHRLGGPAKARRRPPRTSPSGSIAAACARGIRWRAAGKERSTARRRGREGQKGTAALRAAPPLENPVEGRLRRALRRASPRRPWKSPRCSRPQRGCSRGRSPPRRRRWRRGC